MLCRRDVPHCKAALLYKNILLHCDVIVATPPQGNNIKHGRMCHDIWSYIYMCTCIVEQAKIEQDSVIKHVVDEAVW